jgi:predicted dinucleotide-binding enzyme
MSFKRLVSMDIAIIGNTDIAAFYASQFAQQGHNIYMACCEKNNVIVRNIPDPNNRISYTSISDAANNADFIIIATVPIEVREASYWLGDVRKKVIIDVTANVFAQDIDQVKTVCAIKAITGSPHVIKIFHTGGYESILKPLFNGAKVDLLLLSDSKKAKEITKIMATEIGMKYFYDFGGSDNIPLFNEITKCWRKLKLQNEKRDVVATSLNIKVKKEN